MSVYVCPCRRCPKCKSDVSLEPDGHPIDGLAFGCESETCDWHAEWWAVSGPHMDGRHITSAGEEAAWRAYDDSIHREATL